MSVLDSGDHVVVVGAGLAGWRFVEGLRREGFNGRVSLIGEESATPYDRPPLSKQVLSQKWAPERTELASRDRLEELRVEFHGSVRARSLDVLNRLVHLESDESVAGTHVVIASGVRARQLKFSATHLVHTVRTVNDVTGLLDDLAQVAPGAQIAVIGGGFIGAEAATSLAASGFRPVVLEAMVRPLFNVLGEEVSMWLSQLANDASIELRCSQVISDVVEDKDQLRVLFEDGSSLLTPLVVLAVGAQVNTEWLETSGLELRSGVVVDDHMRAREGIYAIGDVARFTWRHDPFVEELRIEHWQCANDHAQYLASSLMDPRDVSAPISMVPYFWSDQYGKKIQMLGHPAPSDSVQRVIGSDAEGKWLAIYSRDEVVTGLIGLNQPRALMVSRELVADHVALSDALRQAPWQ
jgi:NAD(P)H-nitrite reductase large subunit